MCRREGHCVGCVANPLPDASPLIFHLSCPHANARIYLRTSGIAITNAGLNPKNFFAELKRRKVYRVAAAYAVASWLLIQIATQVFPFFEIPNWAVRLVVLVLCLGFPIAVILAWVFDITPQGIRRTDEISAEQKSISVGKTQIPRKSIAVLPFENLSNDKENEYFAAGVHDDVLSSLAKVADLKVISRTSVQQFKSGSRNPCARICHRERRRACKFTRRAISTPMNFICAPAACFTGLAAAIPMTRGRKRSA